MEPIRCAVWMGVGRRKADWIYFRRVHTRGKSTPTRERAVMNARSRRWAFNWVCLQGCTQTKRGTEEGKSIDGDNRAGLDAGQAEGQLGNGDPVNEDGADAPWLSGAVRQLAVAGATATRITLFFDNHDYPQGSTRRLAEDARRRTERAIVPG